MRIDLNQLSNKLLEKQVLFSAPGTIPTTGEKGEVKLVHVSHPDAFFKYSVHFNEVTYTAKDMEHAVELYNMFLG